LVDASVAFVPLHQLLELTATILEPDFYLQTITWIDIIWTNNGDNNDNNDNKWSKNFDYRPHHTTIE